MVQLSFGGELKRLRESRGLTRGELALKSGIKEDSIVSLEKRDSPRPSADNILKLAKAFEMDLAQVYERLGLGTLEEHPATFYDLWERARLAAPLQIPVYSDFKVHLGETKEIPVDYVYYSRQKAGNRHLEAFLCSGYCMAPKINDGDTIIVDIDSPPSDNDIVLCLANGELVLGHYKSNDGQPLVQNGHGTHSLDGCQRWGVIIGVYRSLK